jgi:hypothetical protein
MRITRGRRNHSNVDVFHGDILLTIPSVPSIRIKTLMLRNQRALDTEAAAVATESSSRKKWDGWTMVRDGDDSDSSSKKRGDK